METRTTFGASLRRRGVNAQGVDLPISVFKCLGVLVDNWQRITVSEPHSASAEIQLTIAARQGRTARFRPNRIGTGPIALDITK